ncbi:MAG: type VI secretion system protein TssA [Polyangiales bacterium]
MALDAYLERTAPLRASFPGDAPSGQDVSFDPEFEKLKGEIDKLTSVSGGQPNWREIDSIASQILSAKAKDFRVASWLAVARMQQSGYAGFAEGLAIMRSLIDEHWVTMYPDVKRGRARANMLTWMTDTAVAHFEPRDVGPSDGDDVRAIDELIGAIDSALAEKLGELYPGVNKLRNMFRNKVRAIPAAEPPKPAEPPPQAAPPPPTAEAAPPPAPVASAPTAPASADDAIATVRACGKTLVETAKVMRKADPAAANAYRLHRVGLWLAVQAPPPAENGKTRLPTPSADVKKKIQAAMDGQKWLDLLNIAEDASASSLYWFDLHRLVAVAMDNLGALFIGAREVVGKELVGFVQRFPALPTLSFTDGTPFADPATKSFLEAEAKKHGGGGGSGAATSSAVSEEDAELEKRFTEAREMVTNGKVGEGLALATQLAARAPDARARFRSRLNVAQLAAEGGKPEVARPVLEALAAEVDQHGLETWEPSLCATVYAGLLACLKGPSTKPTPEVASRKDWLFDRLCRLDPAAAVRLANS